MGPFLCTVSPREITHEHKFEDAISVRKQVPCTYIRTDKLFQEKTQALIFQHVKILIV